MAFSVGATVGIAGAYLLLKNPPMPGVNFPAPLPSAEAPAVDANVPYTSSTDDQNPLPSSTLEQIEVDWKKTKEMSFVEEFKKGGKTWVAINEGEDIGYIEVFPSVSGWILGTVKDGKYKGYDLIKWSWAEGGMGSEGFYVDVLASPDRKIWLTDYSIEAPKILNKWIEKNFARGNFSLEAKSLPQTLNLVGGGVLSLVASGTTNYYTCNAIFCDQKKFGITKEGVSVYTGVDTYIGMGRSVKDAYVAYSEDGQVFAYSALQPELVKQSGIQTVKSNEIAWSGPIKGVNVEYDPTYTGGCGIHDYGKVVTSDEANSGGGLQEAGTFLNQKVYIPKNPAENTLVKVAYEGWLTFDEKKTMGDFLKKFPVPVFFQKDTLNQWIRFQVTDAIPAAECGKPVIYLYPEKTTDISVRLPSFVNVTVSDPTYPRQGWNVTAHPDGSLQYADGKTYGSLYWEGTGIGYQTPKTGWIVKGSEAEAFLDRTLVQYGLNKKESQDFKDFWLPIMQKHDLMRVSFLVEDWSKAAPLSITPRPDTNIRIFMDWQPVSEASNIKPPVIKTPTRKGFTLVEWGGTLYR